MAICETGYLCDVCGEEVEEIGDSCLYLKYVLGEVEADRLTATAERHLRCDPTLAQFIIWEGFEPVLVDGPFSKRFLDPQFVAEEEKRVSRAYGRLVEIARSPEPVPIVDYPIALTDGR